MDRQEILSSVENLPDVSVLIVGGGINGIGTFRELALNGVDVLLIEKGDFCSGASAASSHMAHGGLRYLENGEFRLVREAVQERDRLIQNAPHLVKPLPTTIPIFKRFSGMFNAPLQFLGVLDRSSERGSIVIKAGLLLYEAFTGRNRIMPRHKFLSRRASLNRWPNLNQDIINTVTYFDGIILNPERLGLELILDAEKGNRRARALNYAKFIGVNGSQVSWRDEISGRIYLTRPRLLINASGAWIDESNCQLGRITHYISGTKGSHLVLDHPELLAVIGEHEFFFENKDGRIVLILPLADRVLIGTSDLPCEDPDSARCSEEEVDYFLGMIARVFPGIEVKKEHIIFRFSGVRPLAHSSKANTGRITRDHAIRVLNNDSTGLSFPIFSLVGGKWTGFRAFSEQVADKAFTFLGISRQKNTKDLPIGGGYGFSDRTENLKKVIDRLKTGSKLPPERLRELYMRYGSRAEEVVDYIDHAHDLLLISSPRLNETENQVYTRREIEYLALHEKIVHLDDLVIRRTMLAKSGRLTKPRLAQLSEIAGAVLGWDDQEKNSEVERTLAILADRHGVKL